MNKRKPGKIRLVIMILLVISILVVNVFFAYTSNMLDNVLSTKRYEEELAKETKQTAESVNQETVGEGCVLLKNNQDVLPIAGETKVNVFGWQSLYPLYGGTGSGSSDTSESIDFYQALENAGIVYNEELKSFYEKLELTRPTQSGYDGSNFEIVEAKRTDYSEELVANAKDFSDTAIIYLSRLGGESLDCPTNMYQEGLSNEDDGRHYLEITAEEEKMLQMVTKEYGFENTIVIINSCNVFECAFLDTYDIDACLWIGAPGAKGMEAVGKILSGAINPSGKLPDTWPYDLTKDPTYYNLGDFSYTNTSYYKISNLGIYRDEPSQYKFIDYEEGIYVGYRFYETRYINNETGLCDEEKYQQMVQFPFGFGLSYTEFEQEIVDYKVLDDTILLDVQVKNTGSSEGKEVVEIYYTAPYTVGGIEKSHVVLGAFEKTSWLKPGETEIIQIELKKEDMASYDYQKLYAKKGAYVLEEGMYEIKLMSDAHNVIDSFSFEQEKTVIYDEENEGKRSSDLVTAVNLFENCESDKTNQTLYVSRADWEGTLPSEYPSDREAPDWLVDSFENNDIGGEYDVITNAKNGLTLSDLKAADYEDERWQLLIEQMSVKELQDLVALGGHQTKEIHSIGKAKTKDENGPTGINAMMPGDTSGASYCSEPLMAATWNTELIYQLGEVLGNEMLARGIDGIYGPGMNLHRSPFGGRNFEYYSEDALLSGKMGAAEVAGIQSNGKTYAYMKHFALNDQEINHVGATMWCNEQAMRELYLKPFELSVKEGGCLAAMGTLNLVGDRWTGANANLNNKLLRDEWGFQGFIVSDYKCGEYMNVDDGIRGGINLMDTYLGDFPTEVFDESIYYMQQAAKGILYVTVRTEAQNMYTGFYIANWIYIAVAINVVLLSLVGILFWSRRKALKKYKENLKEND